MNAANAPFAHREKMQCEHPLAEA